MSRLNITLEWIIKPVDGDGNALVGGHAPPDEDVLAGARLLLYEDHCPLLLPGLRWLCCCVLAPALCCGCCWPWSRSGSCAVTPDTNGKDSL